MLQYRIHVQLPSYYYSSYCSILAGCSSVAAVGQIKKQREKHQTRKSRYLAAETHTPHASLESVATTAATSLSLLLPLPAGQSVWLVEGGSVGVGRAKEFTIRRGRLLTTGINLRCDLGAEWMLRNGHLAPSTFISAYLSWLFKVGGCV